MSMETAPLELYEEYNQDGVCIRRTINGIDLPADTEPSIQILVNCTALTQKKYMTKEEVRHIYGKELLELDETSGLWHGY